MLAQVQTPEAISQWAEFGLAGLVIFALFGVLVFLFRSHKEERKEWREDAKEMHRETTETTTGLTKVVSELTEAVKEMGRRV